MKTLFRWLFRIIFGLIFVIILLFTAAALLKLPIDLTILKVPIETVVTKALNRSVSIEKSIIIHTSLKPELTLEGLRIGNSGDFSEDTLMYLESARVQVELLPMLQRKIHIEHIGVGKLVLNLMENENGAVNWAASSGSGTAVRPDTKENKSAGSAPSKKDDITGDFIVVKKIELDDIAVNYYSPGTSEPSTYQIEKCLGSMLPGKPLALDIDGSLLSFPYSLAVTIASLEEFLRENSSWIEIQAEISGTKLRFSGNVDFAEAHRSLALKAAFSGEKLSSLNDLLGLDLPPLNSYSVETDLFSKENHFSMNNLTVKTGSSILLGTAEITKTGDKTKAVIEFISPRFQINDFVFDDWTWSGEKTDAVTGEEPGEGNAAKVEVVESQEITPDKNKKLLDPELLEEFDVMLMVRAEQVLSGEDKLGNGHLKLTVRDGRIALDPLELKVPGGSVALAVSIKPGDKKSDASIKAVMHNFDIGIMVRRNKPESKMGGLVNLDMNLQSSAATPRELLENGNGYFDFSGNLENLSAGIIDLWAVNLIAAIVSSTEKKQSTINCAVGRWSVVDGTLTPDVFFIDTSKIRICGRGRVDFKDEYIDLVITPTSKKPEFFNLATPLEVRGSFDDMNIGIESGGVIGTAIKFITSPVHVPLQRVISDKIPKDGSDACKVVLGPDNRTETSVAGCR